MKKIIDDICEHIGRHGLWRGKLLRAINEGILEESLDEIKQTKHIGEWAHNIVPEEFRKSEHYSELIDIHNRFHETVAKVAELAISGKKEKALKMMESHGEFGIVSRELTNFLVKIRKLYGS